MASPAENVVTEFCNAWTKLDVNGIMNFFTDDAVYHNIPMPVAKGKEVIHKTIEGLLDGATRIEFKILHSASNGNVVFNERVDSSRLAAKKSRCLSRGSLKLPTMAKSKRGAIIST